MIRGPADPQEILRRYERGDLRAEIYDRHGGIRARVVCQFEHRECPAIDRAFATMSEAESWTRRMLHLDEAQQEALPLPSQTVL